MLKLENVKKVYDGVTILENISLEIEEGEIVSILGPSGCGKTTLLNLILGIADADGGRILYNGEDITEVPMEKRGFNIVFQDYALFPNLNVYDNITYGLRNRPEISSREEVGELIDLLGLKEHLKKRIDQLSGGQQQRVAIARALALHPDILCFDEPTSALDPELTGEVLRVLRELAEHKTTMIIVTHEMKFARDAADRILFMDGGVVVEQGDAKELIDHPKEERTRQFLASYGK